MLHDFELAGRRVRLWQHRPDGRAVLINFVADIAERTRSRRIERVPEEWYGRTQI